jgi:MEMO1 family protein
MFSGPVAGHAYRAVQGRAFDAAVLVGPSHFVGFDGVAIYGRGAFDSPLGSFPIAEGYADALARSSSIIRLDPRPHEREHSLEMQLPFLGRVLPGIHLVPLLIGFQVRETIVELGRVLASTLADEPVLLVASTDLSHYCAAREAARLDGRTLEYVEAFDPDGLLAEFERYPEAERGRYVACGGGAAIAVMTAARALGAKQARILRYADSGDVSGDKEAVVGYLAAAFGRFA